MSAFIEADQNTTMRKRRPLRESFIEAFPEQTPVLTMIRKNSGKRTTSPTSSEVEWPFKTFRAPRNRAVYDGEDVDFATEGENNESNKTMLKGRIQLIRSAVQTGRIAEASISQHGGVEAGTKNSIHRDHVKDALRGMREDKNFIIMSDADSKAQAVVSGTKVPYQTRGFASWCRTGAHADLPIDSMARIPSGSIKSVSSPSAFEEADLNAMLQSCWNARLANGNWQMFCTADMQTVLNNFLCFGEQSSTSFPIRRFNADASKGVIELNVRMYKGSFGQVNSVPLKNLPTSTTINGTTTNLSATISGLSSTAAIYPGMPVSGTGIAAGSRVSYIVSATSVVLDTAATASGTVPLTFGQVVYAELMDMEFLEWNYVDEVSWAHLEDKGGGPRGYADCLAFLANLNPQAHGIIQKS